MTDRATLEALLARVLEGKGPDRELDGEIDLYLLEAGLRAERFSIPFGAPPYTASLDAALTLVPDGWGWTVFDADPVRRNPPGAFLVDNTYLPPDDPFEYDRPVVEASATTPARALIAACIKARMEVQPLSNP